MSKRDVSEEYIRAGGDKMTREQAVRHFHNRELKLKQEILALPLHEKFHLVAEFLTLPTGSVSLQIPRNIARAALAELEALAAQAEPTAGQEGK